MTGFHQIGCPPPAAQLRGVAKSFAWGKLDVPALRGVDLTIAAGEFLVITGPSGSGKSTLLNLLGCIDRPDAGRIMVGGQDVADLDEAGRTDFRARRIGFVFQNFNLLPVLSALENVEYPLRLTRLADAERRSRALETLAAVGLGDYAHRRPAELSGGQRQRVAIARALVKRPVLAIADEPTANLDRATSTEVIDLMRAMQRQVGTTFVFSSHDPYLISRADRCLHLVDGLLHDVARGATVTGRESIHEYA